MAKNKNKENEKVEVKILSPEEEQEKLNKSLDLIELCKEKSETPFDVAAENERAVIFKTYKKTRTRNNIIMSVVVVLFVVSMFLFMNPAYDNWGKIVGGVTIGVTFVFLVVHYILTKNIFPNTTKTYIRNFFQIVDNYVFDIPDAHDQKLYHEKRYAMTDVISDRCYKDVIDVVSRNIVSGTYKEKPFECGELALYKAGAKRGQKVVAFVGKYLSFENKLHFEERYIIQIKGQTVTDSPNDIDDLVVVSEQNNFVIYGKEGAQVEKDLGKDLINNLKSIECVDSLLNVNIVLWAGHTSVYLSYDDKIVAIPFDHAIEANGYVQLKKNITDIFEILLG